MRHTPERDALCAHHTTHAQRVVCTTRCARQRFVRRRLVERPPHEVRHCGRAHARVLRLRLPAACGAALLIGAAAVVTTLRRAAARANLPRQTAARVCARRPAAMSCGLRARTATRGCARLHTTAVCARRGCTPAVPPHGGIYSRERTAAHGHGHLRTLSVPRRCPPAFDSEHVRAAPRRAAVHCRDVLSAATHVDYLLRGAHTHPVRKRRTKTVVRLAMYLSLSLSLSLSLMRVCVCARAGNTVRLLLRQCGHHC